MENEENKQPEEQKAPEQKQESATSVEQLIKSYEEKFTKMQEENNKKLAEKDEIIKQLILQNGKDEPELTDDEKSCQSIIDKINKRR